MKNIYHVPGQGSLLIPRHDEESTQKSLAEFLAARKEALQKAAPDLYRVALALKLWGEGTLRHQGDLDAIIELAVTTVGKIP